MATYAKSKKTRTMERGLRPFSKPIQDSFPKKEIEKMAELIEKILANCRVLDERDNWVLDQALVAVAFRLAESNEERNKVMREIQKHRERAHSLGFGEIEIRAINRVILEKDLAGQLGGFSQRLFIRRGKK